MFSDEFGEGSRVVTSAEFNEELAGLRAAWAHIPGGGHDPQRRVGLRGARGGCGLELRAVGPDLWNTSPSQSFAFTRPNIDNDHCGPSLVGEGNSLNAKG